MSVKRWISDIARRWHHFREGPFPDSCIAAKQTLFDHLSALASTDAGRSRPSDLAVFRLTTSSYLVGVCTGRSAGFAPALISAILGHAGAAPTSASSSFKARTKLPGGPRRGLGLSQSGRQMHALLSFTFLDLKCGSASSRAVPPV